MLLYFWLPTWTMCRSLAISIKFQSNFDYWKSQKSLDFITFNFFLFFFTIYSQAKKAEVSTPLNSGNLFQPFLTLKIKIKNSKIKWFWKVKPELRKTLIKNLQIPISGFQCVAKNIKGWLKFYISYLVYSQVWLILPRDDCNCKLQTKIARNTIRSMWVETIVVDYLFPILFPIVAFGNTL